VRANHPEWWGDYDDKHVWRDINWWAVKQPQAAVQRHPDWRQPLQQSIERQHAVHQQALERQHDVQVQRVEQQYAEQQQTLAKAMLPN
jgi:hypothetical protein